MKVLLVVPSLDVPKFKGLAKVSLKLLEGLSKKGIDVEVYEVHKKKKNYLKNLTSTPLKEFFAKADIIHATTPESASFFGFIKKIRNVKTVVTFHDFIPIEMAEELDFKFKKLVKLYTTLMWKGACYSDKVVAVSSQTAEDLKRIFGRKADAVINPGVDEKFRPLNVKKEKLTLGFFANFSYRKNVKFAIDTFKILKEKVDCKLILAGGELQTVYQRQYNVRELVKGLEDVEILGYIPDNKVVELYNSFDFFIFPSVYEGFGIPILEAQACGIPTIVLKNARIPDEVTEKAIKCSTPEEAANKILEIWSSKEDYERIRKEGIEHAKRFSWDDFVEGYIEIYESLL